MQNNEVLQQLCEILTLSEADIAAIFKQVDVEVSPDNITKWLCPVGDAKSKKCKDGELVNFLDGLINFKRGKKEGAQPKPVKKLTNNIVLKKVKIALDLKGEDMQDILSLAGCDLSNHEISAFFRATTHKHFRECADDVLNQFFIGLAARTVHDE